MAWQRPRHTYSPGPRPTGQFPTPTWSWASVGSTVGYLKIDDYLLSRPQLAMEPTHDTSCPEQAPRLLLFKGKLIPCSLRLARALRPEHYSGKCWDDDGMEIQVKSAYLRENSKSMSLLSPHYDFLADFDMRTSDWDCEAWYDVVVVRLGLSDMVDEYHLVLWRYGKAIPGSGVERYTKDNHPIYQRIGMLLFLPFADRNEVEAEACMDWSKADEVMIAIE
jgi:hypothetical protein